MPIFGLISFVISLILMIVALFGGNRGRLGFVEQEPAAVRVFSLVGCHVVLRVGSALPGAARLRVGSLLVAQRCSSSASEQLASRPRGAHRHFMLLPFLAFFFLLEGLEQVDGTGILVREVE